MTRVLTPTYTLGTHRLLPPELTFARIAPHLKHCGITRCAAITGLDVDLGVPTYCAIRPTGRVLQTCNGKGLTPISAKVSALMEAIELYHAEHPEPRRLRRASLNDLRRHAWHVVRPEQLPGYAHRFFSDDYRIDWVRGENLISQAPLWAPASAVYFGEPSLYRTSTNGLASGNHPVEATLHALYELIERDAISNLDVDGRLQIKDKCRVIDTRTIPDNHLQKVIDKIDRAQSQLILLWVPSCIDIHTFWAILLNHAPFRSVSTLNAGCGTHINIYVAASRAITEAIQSRLTFIHGSRDDIITKPVYHAADTVSSAAYKYFAHLEVDTRWHEIKDRARYNHNDLLEICAYVLCEMEKAGHQRVFCFDLTGSICDIPVVKVIVPSLKFKRDFF